MLVVKPASFLQCFRFALRFFVSSTIEIAFSFAMLIMESVLISRCNCISDTSRFFSEELCFFGFVHLRQVLAFFQQLFVVRNGPLGVGLGILTELCVLGFEALDFILEERRTCIRMTTQIPRSASA